MTKGIESGPLGEYNTGMVHGETDRKGPAPSKEGLLYDERAMNNIDMGVAYEVSQKLKKSMEWKWVMPDHSLEVW